MILMIRTSRVTNYANISVNLPRKYEVYMKVLITGTSQGIGRAVAELFLEKGHCVVGIDRQEA
jgi:hypothetical protein